MSRAAGCETSSREMICVSFRGPGHVHILCQMSQKRRADGSESALVASGPTLSQAILTSILAPWQCTGCVRATHAVPVLDLCRRNPPLAPAVKRTTHPRGVAEDPGPDAYQAISRAHAARANTFFDKKSALLGCV